MDPMTMAILASLALGGGAGGAYASGQDPLEWLFGHSPRMKQADLLTEAQKNLQGQITGGKGATGLSSGLDYINQLLSGDEAAFKDFEAPIKRQFEQEVIPTISERFAGMGSGGSQGSSAFANSLGQAGRELSQNLAQLRSGLKSQALSNLQGLTSIGLQPTFQPLYDQGSTGIVGGMLQAGAQGAGKAAGNYFLPTG